VRPVLRPAPQGAGALRSTPVLLVALWVVWGSAFLFIKGGTDHAPPLTFGALRLGIGAVVVAVLLRLAKVPPAPPGARRALHRYGLVLGLTNGALFYALQTSGISLSDTGFSAVIIYTQPLFVALLARRFLGERLTGRQVLGLMAGWVGVALAGAAGLRSGAASPGGFALLLGSAAIWAAGSIVVKRAPAQLPLMRLLLWQSVYGVIPLAVVSVLVGGDVDWGPALVGAALWAGAVATAGGFALQFALLRRGQASVVSAWAFAVPVISTALGVTVLDERLTPGLVLGAAAVALAIWLVSPRRDPVPLSPQ
jgi:O-acetylserine/cysteine efflux transporter